MATVYEVDATEIIEKAAAMLKQEGLVTPPKWAPFVKTGMHKERTPLRDDWWYLRAASVLRKIYLHGPIGVSKLRRYYGGRKNRGHKTEHFYKGSGNILRKILQQLQKSELIKFAEKGVHKGRVITPKGVSFLDKISTEIYTRVHQVPSTPKKEAEAKETKETVKEHPKKESKAAKAKNG